MKLVFLFLLLAGVLCCPSQAIDCLEPGTRIVSRWTNGNYYKGEIESLTNRINVIFDTGVRHSYNTRDYEDIVLDRIPDPTDVPWGNQILVNRPRSRAFEIGYIREFKNGRYVILYENGDIIHHTLDQIRIFNSSKACDEPAYLGCYKDNVPRYLQVFIPTHPSTIGACVEACKSQGFSIAGLRNSDLCFCGNQYTKDYQTEEMQCDMPCYDNSFETCGGYMAFSQYWTGLVDSGQNVRYPGQQGYYGYLQTGAQRHSIPQYGQIPWQTLIQARSQFRNSVANQARAGTWNPAWSTGRAWGGRSGYQRSFANTRPRTNYQRVYSSYRSPGRSQYPGSAPAQYRTYSPRRYAWPYSYYNKQRGQTYSTWKRPQGTYATYRGPQRYATVRTQTKANSAQGSFSDTLQTVGWKLFGPKSRVIPTSINEIAGFRYLGCFKDSRVRDLPVAMDVRPLTIKSCVQKCRNSKYSVAGVQSSSQCFCGDSYSRYGRLRNEKCTMRCTGNHSEICGGEMKNVVFFTGYGSATPYEDLPAVRLKHPPIQSNAKFQSSITSISTKQNKLVPHGIRTKPVLKASPHLEVKLLIKKIDKDLHRATKTGRLASKQPSPHSLATGKATNNGHVVQTASSSSKKPLTHKQLKNILAVLSQWPSVDEKPKLKKPASSFKKLKAILDDMTPDFIKTLAYRIVAGKMRRRHKEKAGKRHQGDEISEKSTARHKAIEARIVGVKTNENKISDWEPSKMKHSKLNASKSNNLITTKARTGAKPIGLKLWSVKQISKNKPSKLNSSSIRVHTESIHSDPEVPDGSGVRTKDLGRKENGSKTVSKEGIKMLLEKRKKASKQKFINATRDEVSDILFRNHSGISLIKSAGKLSENSTIDEGSAEASTSVEDDVVETFGQTSLSRNESTSNNMSSPYDNNATMATDEYNRYPLHGNALNVNYVSQNNAGSGKEPTSEKRESSNATNLFALKTFLTLAAGDKRSTISHVLDNAHAVTQVGKKDAGKKSMTSTPFRKIITKSSGKLTEGNSSPHKKVLNLEKDKFPGGEKAVGKTLNGSQTLGKSENGVPVDGKSTKRKVVFMAKNVVKKKPSQKHKTKQSKSDKPLKIIQVKRKTSSKKSPHKMFTKSKTKDRNVSRGKPKEPTNKDSVNLHLKLRKNTKAQETKSVKITLISRAPQEEADTENLDDSNSANQLISKGSHLSR